MKSKARGTILPLQQAEFHALPYSVQRKYFSSLERLQIQQQSVEDRSEPPTSARSSQATTSSKPHRPSLSLGTGRRKRKPDKPLDHHHVFHVDLDFYLALPEKVRKQHFSPHEEQVLLLQRSRHTTHHQADWAQQRFDDFHFDFSEPAAIDVPERGRSRSRSSASSAPISPSRTPFAFGPSADDQDRPSNSLYLDMMGTPIFTRRETATADGRRTMSLTTNQLRHGTSASLTMADIRPPSTAIAERRHQRAHSSSLSARRMSHTPTPPVFDPEATYYQDPEARKKLRMYLASPQKFDEAIEFGFPSTPGHESVTPHYQLPQIVSHARKFSRDMHTFLRDGHLSFFEDTSNDNQGLESDDDSVADVNSPATPSSTNLSFRLHSRQFSNRKYSVESPAPSPISAHGQLNREMTLRMTLTRPDLRADEDQLYGWQGSSSSSHSASPSSTKVMAAAIPAPKDDPLALEDLVFSDDMTGTKGAFYIKPKPRGNLVTRILKRASLKGR
ncbi:hypothetical protein P3342_011007 [Pyrenophora teres f. teres]|uniref:Uncharacterized protein n=2 Tax=Pyrenophora teres f. teres TaxID=97479 RepID=E3RH66_PYRTT|nr:hypothetical protein PTT_07231 [Pyrenophora teres f. teres 0-1]KAE8829278.1 hypothetical protein PTNB85_08466 [Pyrenophora teres f. teres]KAE8830440.1 hypothetical protein HRS9139_07064 [Pyrenophora teres f. teres]KAE8841224.1 hypothetical protein HRS9122_05350 [Pyrenophora teres f. teres]KAE8859325.1 hypothetical protein PTNB29_06556 [Pyrenophora teres f. teres]